MKTAKGRLARAQGSRRRTEKGPRANAREQWLNLPYLERKKQTSRSKKLRFPMKKKMRVKRPTPRHVVIK